MAQELRRLESKPGYSKSITDDVCKVCQFDRMVLSHYIAPDIWGLTCLNPDCKVTYEA